MTSISVPGMAEIGIVFGALGTINLLAQRLSGLKNRIKDFGSLPDNWDSSIMSFKSCQEYLDRIHSRLVTDQERIGERTANELRFILIKVEDFLIKVEDFLIKVEDFLTKAELIVKRLENEITREGSSATASGGAHGAGSSSKQCRPLFQSKNRCVDGRQVKESKLLLRSGKVKTELESLVAIWRDALHTMDGVRIGLEVIMATLDVSSDKYRRHFDEPLAPNDVVLDFSGDTMEAELKRVVLSNSSCAIETVALSPGLVGAVGMAGVGKTVALQHLCGESDLQKKYIHGVFFSSLGQNVTEKDVIECVAHFVESSGGECLAKEIMTKTSADSAAKQASLWFKGLRTLFVCDDIWSLDGLSSGYLASLKLLLSNSRCSAMVISTRERSVARQLVKVNFIPREPHGEQAWRMLAKYAGLERENIRGSSATSAASRDILDVCCGLPVALAAAGTSLRNSIEVGNGMIGQCVVEFARELKENIESVRDESVNEYRGLRAVIDTSLLHCEAWAKGAEGVQKLGCKLNVRDKFEALSVVRMQGWIPQTCLKRLWETSERATKRLMSKLSDMHLVSRHRQSTPGGEIDGLVLHDLILEHARRLSVRNKRAEHWHAQILNGYLRKAAGSVAAPENHDCREWWDREKVPEDGYIEKNVAWHLKMSGGCELELLLSDIRWSMRRMEVGGLVALRDDFHDLSIESQRDVGVEAVRRALEEDWSTMSKSRHSIPFAMYGRLQAKRTSSEFVERFLSSVWMAYHPHTNLAPIDNVELSVNIDLASGASTRMWCLNSGEKVSSMFTSSSGSAVKQWFSYLVSYLAWIHCSDNCEAHDLPSQKRKHHDNLCEVWKILLLQEYSFWSSLNENGCGSMWNSQAHADRILLQKVNTQSFIVFMCDFFMAFDDESDLLLMVVPSSKAVVVSSADFSMNDILDEAPVEQVHFMARRLVQLTSISWDYGCLARLEQTLPGSERLSRISEVLFRGKSVDLDPCYLEVLIGCKVGLIGSGPYIAPYSRVICLEIFEKVIGLTWSPSGIASPKVLPNGTITTIDKITDYVDLSIGGHHDEAKTLPNSLRFQGEKELNLSFVPQNRSFDNIRRITYKDEEDLEKLENAVLDLGYGEQFAHLIRRAATTSFTPGEYKFQQVQEFVLSTWSDNSHRNSVPLTFDFSKKKFRRNILRKGTSFLVRNDSGLCVAKSTRNIQKNVTFGLNLKIVTATVGFTSSIPTGLQVGLVNNLLDATERLRGKLTGFKKFRGQGSWYKVHRKGMSDILCALTFLCVMLKGKVKPGGKFGDCVPHDNQDGQKVDFNIPVPYGVAKTTFLFGYKPDVILEGKEHGPLYLINGGGWDPKRNYDIPAVIAKPIDPIAVKQTLLAACAVNREPTAREVQAVHGLLATAESQETNENFNVLCDVAAESVARTVQPIHR